MSVASPRPNARRLSRAPLGASMLKKIVFELLLQFQYFWVWYRPGEMFPNEKVRQVLKRLWEWSRTQQSVHWTGGESGGFCERHAIVFSGESCPLCTARQ